LEITKLARDMTPAVVERLFKIAMNELDDIEVAPRDQIAAGTALMDRGCGRPAIGIYHGTGPGQPPGHVPEGEEDGTTALLLRAAAAKADERVLADLKAAQSRIEAKLTQEEQAHEAHLADAADAMARGEEVPGLTRLLLNAKAASVANADRRAAAAPPPRRPPALEARPDVFVADSSGNIAAPAPTEESAPSTPKPESAPKPPPFKIEPDPPPKAATKPAPKVTHPGANIPGFGEFLSEKAARDADAERAKKVEAARARGQCQIPPSEAFPPDPREGPEIVNFTRIPGGRGIRRVG
jgi:hypothetical protein